MLYFILFLFVAPPPIVNSTIAITEFQNGVAGTDKKTLYIEPNGNCTYVITAHNINGKIELAKLKKGKINNHKKLYDLLPKKEFTVGKKAKVNAHIYFVKYEGKKWEIHGVPPFRGGKLSDHINKWTPDAKPISPLIQYAKDNCTIEIFK